MNLANKVLLNASALAAGRFAAAGMGIVAVGVSTRYLGVGEYGALATAIAFTAIVNTLTDIGIWQIGARELAKRPEAKQEIAGALMTAGLGLSFAAAVLGVGATLLVYGGAEDELVRDAALLLLVTFPLAAPNGVIGALFVAQQRAYLGMAASVFGSVVTLSGIVLVAGLDWGFTAIVLVYVAASVIQFVLMVLLARGAIRLRPSWNTALARQLLVWAVPLGGAFLVYTLYWRIDLVLLSLLASDYEVGLYGLAYRVVDVLVTIPGFITITLLPEYARLSERRERFAEVLEKAQAVMLVGALGLTVFLMSFAGEIAEVVGGGDFGGAGAVLRILAVGVGLNFLSASFGQAFVAMNRQKRLFVLAVALLPLNLGLNFALIPPLGAEGAALAFATTEVFHLAIIVLLFRGFAEPPRPRSLPRVALAAGCMALVSLGKLLPLDLDAAITLAAGGGLSVAIYIGALYTLRAMPAEVHANVFVPLWSRLRP